jgi:hypothetical protein
MTMRYSELFERRDKNVGLGAIIAAAIKAKDSLSDAAQRAITDWTSANWATGTLEKSFRSNGIIAQEITQAFAPVKDIIRTSYGDTITLHRGQRNYDADKLTQDRLLFSWTTQTSVADYFIDKPKLYTVFSDADISKAVAQFTSAGYCKLGQKTYKISKEDPQYYLVYKGLSYLTTGCTEDLEDDMLEDQEFNTELNADALERKDMVVTAHISVDDIVWVDNDLDCKEFITKVNPLTL